MYQQKQFSFLFIIRNTIDKSECIVTCFVLIKIVSRRGVRRIGKKILGLRPHKQTSLFHIPARTQYLERIWSRARGKCAELAFWKFVGV